MTTNERLLKAAKQAARWLGNGDAAETFEDIADWFYAETGYMRPGKDAPLALAGSYEQRVAAFDKWANETGMKVREELRAAIAEAEGKVKP